MSKIFISYSHKNKKEAIKVLDALKEKGHDVYLDTFFLRVGVNFRSEIIHQIKNSDGFLVLITNESRHSDYVKIEIGSAMAFHEERLLLIIPLIKDPPTLDAISGLNHLNIEHELQANELAEIIEKIHNDITDFVVKKVQLIREKLVPSLDAIVLYIINAKKRYRYLLRVFFFLGFFSFLILLGVLWTLFAGKMENSETAILSVGVVSVISIVIFLLLIIKVVISENHLDLALFKVKTGDYQGAMNESHASIFFKLDPSLLIVKQKKYE